MLFLTFYGENKGGVKSEPGGTMRFPIIALATLATLGGFIGMPETLGGFAPLSSFLGSVIPEMHSGAGIGTEALFQIITAIVSLGGIYIAYQIFIGRRNRVERDESYPLNVGLSGFLFSGLGFDWLYDHILVIPYTWLSRINRNDIIDYPYKGLSSLNIFLSRLLSRTQTGNLRLYVFAISLGAAIILIILEAL